jgi:hypothetical protein
VHYNRFTIIYFDSGSFIISLKIENGEENIKITIVIKNRIEDQLKHVFIPYISNKKIEN